MEEKVDPPRRHIQKKKAIIRTEIPPSLEWNTRKQIGLKCQRYLRRIDGSNSKLCLSWELTLGRGFLFIQKSVEQKGAELFRNYDSECVQCVHASFHSTDVKKPGSKEDPSSELVITNSFPFNKGAFKKFGPEQYSLCNFGTRLEIIEAKAGVWLDTATKVYKEFSKKYIIRDYLNMDIPAMAIHG
ncbi:uncharacterized protein LOC123708327 [Pieris brassicae]|uniref:uncharacterized protein LOC123708327 n=1 Tax=Pieris brassicae TaxID=7116 RepID=UPI001E65FEBE|nr:uncharacterized protein LOC123708327 [Pieris brassicae]XP_045514956.1 uncharacterized protein LOC123708327 [Pieris brassicae]